MHTTHNDNGPLDRFTERWRKQAAPDSPNKQDVKFLQSMLTTRYSIRCGLLYRFDELEGTHQRVGEDVSRRIAKLNAMGMLETAARGKVRPNDAGLDVLIKFDNLQS